MFERSSVEKKAVGRTTWTEIVSDDTIEKGISVSSKDIAQPSHSAVIIQQEGL